MTIKDFSWWLYRLERCGAINNETSKTILDFVQNFETQLEQAQAEIEEQNKIILSYTKTVDDLSDENERYRHALEEIKARHYNDKTGQIASKALEGSE